MNFGELKAGDFVFVFNANDCSLEQKKLVSVSPQQYSANVQGMTVEIKIDGYSTPFVCSTNTDSVTANLLTITTNKDKVLSTIERCENELTNLINNFELIKQNKEKCTKLRLEYNPMFKQQEENKKEINGLKSEVSELKQMVQQLLNNVGNNK